MPLNLLELVFGGSNYGITPEGGFYETLIYNTEGTSVKGTIVVASKNMQGAVEAAPAGSAVPIGVIYDGGISQGNTVKVVTSGMAQVLLASDQTSHTGYWCGVSSSEAGRMYQLADAPVGTAAHNQEIGHSLQTVTVAGLLSLIQMHFN